MIKHSKPILISVIVILFILFLNEYHIASAKKDIRDSLNNTTWSVTMSVPLPDGTLAGIWEMIKQLHFYLFCGELYADIDGTLYSVSIKGENIILESGMDKITCRYDSFLSGRGRTIVFLYGICEYGSDTDEIITFHGERVH